VVGTAVNIVSRLEGITKASGETVVCSETFASAVPATLTRTIGRVPIKGVDGEHEVFAMAVERDSRA
jgi:adenylate cyclase